MNAADTATRSAWLGLRSYKRNVYSPPSIVSILAKSESNVICLLDDDPSALNATSRFLFSRGWKVEPFTDPEEFLRYAQTHRPPIVAISLWMPRMNGLEVASRLREMSPSTHPIISLKVHCGPKIQRRRMAPDLFVGLIERQCRGTSAGRYSNGQCSSATEEADLDCPRLV